MRLLHYLEIENFKRFGDRQRIELDHPAVLKLRDALASTAWTQALQALPGYAPSSGGQVLSLTQALPWWNFRQAKKPVGDGLQRA